MDTTLSDLEIGNLCDNELAYSQKAIRGIQNTMDTYFMLKTDDTGTFMRKEIEKYKLHYFYYLKLKQLRFKDDCVDVDTDVLSILLLAVHKLINCQKDLIELFDGRMFKEEADKKLKSLKDGLELYERQLDFLQKIKNVVGNL